MDCIFCKIVAGEIPTTRIYEDEETLAFMDINPGNPGHALVITKKHVRNLFDMELEDGAAVMRTVVKVAQGIRDALAPDGLTLVQANEAAGFQVVMHFHMHVLPRWEGDGIVEPWEPKQIDMDAIQATAEKIRACI